MPLIALIALVLAHWFTGPPRVAKMPKRHPRVAHFTGRGRFGYLVSDSMGSIARAVRLAYGYIDINAQVDADGVVWGIHWGRVRSSGWMWICTGHDAKGREIRIRNPHPNMLISDLHTEQVRALRSAKRGGYRPRTMRDHFAHAAAARRRLVVCMEMKKNKRWSQAVLDQVFTDAVQTNCYVIVMTLQNLPGWEKRLTFALNASGVGFQCALLTRGPRPADWAAWSNKGVAKWGAWHPRMVH